MADATSNVYFSGPDCIYRALAKVLPLLGSHHLVEGHPASEQNAIVILCVTTRSSLIEGLGRLELSSCSHVVVLGGDDKLLGAFGRPSALTTRALAELCHFVGTDLFKLMSLLGSPGPASSPTARSHLAQVVHAIQLYRLIELFSHGAKSDLANQLLAPLCMLLQDGPKAREDGVALWNANETRRLWRAFESTVVARIVREPQKYGLMGETLVASSRQLESGIVTRAKAAKVPNLLEAARALMSVFTECRVLAGSATDSTHATPGGNTAHCDPISVGQGDDLFRLLVVDDHSIQLRPVIEHVSHRVLNTLATRDASSAGKSIQIDFSQDADHIDTMNGLVKLRRHLADYDLVLLDIFVGPVNGLALLQEIRQYCHALPVLIWTTSTDREQPAAAILANGFLFKKEVTIKKMADAISGLLTTGKARRQFSLPNPFFDHALRTPELRKIAVDFTQWCLKLLDSFHALDDSYFKYFNDHGGRHIVTLLGILERVVRPMLLRKSPLFSDEGASREQQILALYLSVLCHELGMFPRANERFSRMTGAELRSIRDTHALRGLLLLSEKTYQWAEFGELLRGLPRNLHAAVNLITAYHSRVLSLETAKIFGTVTESAKKKLQDRKANRDTIAAIEAALTSNTAELRASRVFSLRRVRRLCALFRFADAIDVDRTRVPADFLLHGEARSALDDRENLKRQIVESITVDRGNVSIRFAVALPSLDEFAAMLVVYSRASLPVQQLHDLGVAVSQIWADRKKCRLARSHGKAMDEALRQFFMQPNACHLKSVQLLAMLCVCCEIDEEYEAIRSVGFKQYLKLGSVERSEPAIDSLTILDPLHLVPSVQKLNIVGPPGPALDMEDQRAIEAAVRDLLWGVEQRASTGKVQVERINGGYSGASALIVTPSSHQPRFVKVDSHERIATEYRGYKAYASLYIPSENLLSDLRISKYRDRGVLIGSLIANPRTLQERIVSGNMTADEIAMLFSDVLMNKFHPEPPTSFDEGYANYSAGGRFDIRSVEKDLGDALVASARGVNLTQSFRHGDFQTRNVLWIDVLPVQRRFIVIDTFDCGRGHAFDDLAAFWLNISSRVADEAELAGKTPLSELRARYQPLVSAACCAVEGKLRLPEQQFALEFAIARCVHLIKMLSLWPRQFSSVTRVEENTEWARSEVQKALREIAAHKLGV